MPLKTKQSKPDKVVKSIKKTICAFGQTLDIQVHASSVLIEENNQRRQDVYTPFLCANPLNLSGVALDIGAGTGEFSLPFATAYPQWKIWCFEPDPETFSLLKKNIKELKLTNVIALNIAIGAANSRPKKGKILTYLRGKKPKVLKTAGNLQKACVDKAFHIHSDFPNQLRPGRSAAKKSKNLSYPTLSADKLIELNAQFLKLTAPLAEKTILEGLFGANLSHIVGETCSFFPSQTLLAAGKSKQTRAFLPVVTSNDLALRTNIDMHKRSPNLDVVVAMYNTKEYILECIDGIINNTADDIRALVVDDGSTDGCGALVKETYKDNPRVKLLRKANGGCASARNYGRLYSNASHITFVDADDVIDPEMFPQLLDLARYSGAEVVQAGFDFLHMEESGSTRLDDSYESSSNFTDRFVRMPFGKNEYSIIPAHDLMVGQPTIWRRVYRRDFLDYHKIWFPEHIRAFDDQIFQILTLHYAASIPAIDHVKYHYRQHPGQDIKQGDERFFYSLEMFRAIIKQGIREGWGNFTPVLRSYANTVNWIHSGLRPDLKSKFLKGAAELWVYIEMSLGAKALVDVPDTAFTPNDFTYFSNMFRDKLKGFDTSYAWIYLDASEMHVPMLKMVDPAYLDNQVDTPTIKEPNNVIDKIARMPDPAYLDSQVDTPTIKEPNNVIDKIARMDAKLIDGPVSLASVPFDAYHSNLSISIAKSKAPLFLDGVVHNKTIALAETTKPPFVGTSWTLEMTVGGIWLMINQENYDYCLAVSEGKIVLAPYKLGSQDISLHWHILHTNDGFGLCTTHGQLLQVQDGNAKVKPIEGSLDALSLWDIKNI